MVSLNQKNILYFIVLPFLVLGACARGPHLPGLDESGNETASLLDPAIQSSGEPTTQKLIINQSMTLRFEKAGILEAKVELPPGTQVELPNNYEIKMLDYRNSGGGVDRSSTGFVFPVKVVSVATEYSKVLSDTEIEKINQTSGGLYLFASIVGHLQGTTGSFPALSEANPGEGFLKKYSPQGRPLFSFTNSIKKRFGDRLNKGIDIQSLSSRQIEKWRKIYSELVRAVDRTKETEKSFLMIDTKIATQASIDFEKKGIISSIGAWSIATQATAVRHGFQNVPCAEFQSEIIREAYQRAGYRVTDDFNATAGNPLIWSHSAAVVNFSMSLYKAGWVPWDATQYRPITGAILMNGSGLTPGHTYISAGKDGMLIVDNGAPQGRDLRKTTEKIISIMFQTGVFFLPPGINPPSW